MLFRCFSASVLSISLFSCSGSESRENKLVVEEDCQEHVEVPDSFTPAAASQLGSQVDSIFNILHKRRGFNGTVLVTKYDQVVYKGAFGYGDFICKEPLTPNTVFQLASVSKQFTAMAIMMLQEQGKLSYEDTVQQFIPDFPYNGITVRHLLNHRSGLPNYTYFSDQLWPSRKVPLTNDDVLSLMTEHKPAMYFKPGKRFNYSNTGYAVLASIVEKVAEVPFATYLQEQIFDPLKMTRTYTFDPHLFIQKEKVATGYISGRRRRSPDHLDTVLGDKGVFSTVEDLYKWDQALYTQSLVKRETLEEAFAGPGKIDKKSEDYGFGFRLRQVENGDTVIYHGGLWHGFNTYMLRNPKDHSAIIVLSNHTNGSLTHIKDVRNFLYPPQPRMLANGQKPSKQRSANM